jgi:hypothetical protein
MTRLLVLVVLLVPAAVLAQGAPPPASSPPPVYGPAPGAPGAPGAPAAAGVGQIWLGGTGELLTGGDADVSLMGMSQSVSLSTAYAVNGLFEYQVSDLVAIGLMPRYAFGIKGSQTTSSDSLKMLDLRGRISLGQQLQPQLRGYGFGAVGYSIVYPPSTSTDQTTANGITLTIGAGVSYAINPNLRLVFEGGYELGLQSITEAGVTADFHLKYLELGAGLQALIGG